MNKEQVKDTTAYLAGKAERRIGDPKHFVDDAENDVRATGKRP